MKSSYLTVTDQFCGAGGSSIGAAAAGVELRLALNHWKLAIETHASNFPNAIHDCTDVSACDPRRYPSTDILITSPECTNHTVAKGQRRATTQINLFDNKAPDPAAERSRATMWDVPRFAEYHRYNAIVVENVVDARWWTPWDAWLHAMHLLGYEHQIVYFNSMFAPPTPQSRDRMYVVFWRKGNKRPDLEFRPPAHCAHCSKTIEAVQSWKKPHQPWGRYSAQYIYRCPDCKQEVKPFYNPAANAIDWTLPAPRIGDRSRPLTDKTRARIQAGLNKYANHFLVDVIHTPRGDNNAYMIFPADGPMRTQLGQISHALVTQPPTNNALLVHLSHGSKDGGNDDSRVRPASYPMPTQTTRQDVALLIPYYNTGVAKPTSEPVPTVTTTDRHALVVPPPFILGYYTREANIQAAVSSTDDPMPTQSTQPRHYLVQPTAPPTVDDCGFRMLKPHEIKTAMAFPNDYIVLGTGREQVRQYGNAVTPPVMQMLMERVTKTL